jgi:hypothetical protein
LLALFFADAFLGADFFVALVLVPAVFFAADLLPLDFLAAPFFAPPDLPADLPADLLAFPLPDRFEADPPPLRELDFLPPLDAPFDLPLR